MSHSNSISYQDPEKTIFTGAHNHHSENTIDTINNNTYISPGHFDVPTSATFISCQWRNCSAPNGGAIDSERDGIDLTVSNCSFFSCNASVNYGGAIFARSSSNMHASFSLVCECTAMSDGSYADGDGIYIWSASNEILNSSTQLMRCVCSYDGGGFCIAGTFLTISETNCYAFTDCRFHACKCGANGAAILT